MRFEARHRFFKHVSNICCNYRNIVKTVAKRNQLNLSYKFLINQAFNPNKVDIIDTEQMAIQQSPFRSILIQFLNIPEDQEISKATCIDFQGHNIKAGAILVKKWRGEGDLPIFTCVNQIFNYCNRIIFILTDLSTDYFDSHFHSYKIQEPDAESYCCDFTEIELLYPLHISNATNVDGLFIILPYQMY